jgi:hypothetical protein
MHPIVFVLARENKEPGTHPLFGRPHKIVMRKAFALSVTDPAHVFALHERASLSLYSCGWSLIARTRFPVVAVAIFYVVAGLQCTRDAW